MVTKPELVNRESLEAHAGSTAIRSAADSLRELLLRDEYGNECMLGGMVREGLEQVASDLYDLAGMQVLFELWIGEEKP